MKMGNIVLKNILFIFALRGVLFADATITIQYAQTASSDKVPTISKVLFYKKEIPHVTLAQLVNEKQKNTVERKNELFKSWERFYIAQTITGFSAGAAFMVNYINGDSVIAFKRNRLIQEVVKRASIVSPVAYKISASVTLIALAAFPFERYLNFFSLKDINFYYPYEEVENTIAVFRQKTFSHSRAYGNTVIYYYNISDPIGYMLLDEKERELGVINQAFRCWHLSILNAILSVAGLVWAIA